MYSDSGVESLLVDIGFNANSPSPPHPIYPVSQGVLPYYYHKVTDSSRSQMVDRCIYNTMADTDECLYVLPVLSALCVWAYCL
jgi:hypothetical protein